MRQVAWLLKWTLKAAIFFVLFAFALNNPHPVTINWFFGHASVAPLVLVVLATFCAGVAVGVLGMAPRWWRHRQAARKAGRTSGDASAQPAATDLTRVDSA